MSLYIHIPFCRNKCLYCDFYTGGLRIAQWQNYVDALLQELSLRKYEYCKTPSTLYIGGGTPSLVPISELQRLVHGISFITGDKEWEEFTIEVNPEDVSPENIRGWKNLGVNRISMGIQSLNDSELRSLGRRHDAETAVTAFKLLRSSFDNVSVDVMYGLPGQSLESYVSTLDGIIDLSPDHISSYSLMLEEGTAMTLLAKQGKILLPEEEAWEKMYEMTNQKLGEAGYFRYEISNYGRPGKESKHNAAYWKGLPYLGLGPGAHSYDGKRLRSWNPSDIHLYLGNEASVLLSKRNSEILSDDELREEMIMTRLRLAEGMNITEFGRKFGQEEMKQILKKSASSIEKGYMAVENNFLRFTPLGWTISDTLLPALL